MQSSKRPSETGHYSIDASPTKKLHRPSTRSAPTSPALRPRPSTNALYTPPRSRHLPRPSSIHVISPFSLKTPIGGSSSRSTPDTSPSASSNDSSPSPSSATQHPPTTGTREQSNSGAREDEKDPAGMSWEELLAWSSKQRMSIIYVIRYPLYTYILTSQYLSIPLFQLKGIQTVTSRTPYLRTAIVTRGSDGSHFGKMHSILPRLAPARKDNDAVLRMLIISQC